MLMTMTEPLASGVDDARTPKLRHIEAETDRVIREAIARGEFSGVEGEGRPLPLEGDEAGDRWSAHHILRAANFISEWSSLRREIDDGRGHLIRVARAHLEWVIARRARLDVLPAERLLDASRATAHRDAEFRSELAEAADELNARITRYNQLVPVAALQLVPVRSERILELAKAGA